MLTAHQETHFPEEQPEYVDEADRIDIMGCYECMTFVKKAFPDQTWNNVIIKFQDRRQAEFKLVVNSARAAFRGEAVPEIPVPSSVANTRTQSVEVALTMALLTTPELTDILGVTPDSIKMHAKAITFHNEEGTEMEGWLCSLRDFPADYVDSVRKVTIKYTTAVDLSEHLLDVTGQLHMDHGNALFRAASSAALAQRPKPMQAKEDEMLAAQEGDAEAVDTLVLMDADPPEQHRTMSVPTMSTALGSLAAPAAPVEDSKKAAKRKKGKDRSPSPTGTMTSSKKAVSSVGHQTCEDEKETEISQKDPELVCVWKRYVKLKGFEPRSLLQLDPAAFLAGGDDMDGRSLEGVPWTHWIQDMLVG